MIFREYRILRIIGSDVNNKIIMRLIFGALIISLTYMYYYEVHGTELRCKCLDGKKLPPKTIMLGNFWFHRESGGPRCNNNEYFLYLGGGKKHGPGVCLSPHHPFSKWLDKRNDNRWYNVNVTRQPERGPGKITVTLVGLKE